MIQTTEAELVVSQEAVIIPRELFDFLMGTGEIDGTGFGELNDRLLGRFWWRALLQTAEHCTPEAFQRAMTAAYRRGVEDAAKVASQTKAYDDNLQKAAGCVTTGERIARQIRNLTSGERDG